MAKIKNTSGEDRVVPGLGGGRLVLAGQVVDVDPADVTGYTQQEQTWAPADAEAKAAHEEMLEAIAYLRAIDAIDAPEPTDADVAALLTIALSDTDYRDVINELIPAATAEGLVVLIDIERAGKNRTTVIAAAQTRLAEIAGHDDPPANPDQSDDKTVAGTNDSQEG